MKNIENRSVSEYLTPARLIGKIKGKKTSPTVVIFSGIHGNESAGVIASNHVLNRIRKENIPFEGNLFVILGNINGLKKGLRYIDVDLNRIWKQEHINAFKDGSLIMNSEFKEQIEIYNCINNILKTNSGPFYFLDLHTTSSPTIPFITISDSLNNRKFSSNFSVPVVLGIEEFLDGPLLTYINEFGHIALGFEGGEHSDKESVKKCEAFIWTALVYSKCILKRNFDDYNRYKNELAETCYKNEFYEIIYKYIVRKNENFKMHNGFKNFESISKNQNLAQSDGKDIVAKMNGIIFMPLYQELGEDGYFILNKISKFWLFTSILVRRINFHHFLGLIPGVKIDLISNYSLIVDPKIAKYLTKDIFHLFGYRKRIFKNSKLYFTKRDRKISPFE